MKTMNFNFDGEKFIVDSLPATIIFCSLRGSVQHGEFYKLGNLVLYQAKIPAYITTTVGNLILRELKNIWSGPVEINQDRIIFGHLYLGLPNPELDKIKKTEMVRTWTIFKKKVRAQLMERDPLFWGPYFMTKI